MSLIIAVSGHPADQVPPGLCTWHQTEPSVQALGSSAIFHGGNVPTPAMENCPCAEQKRERAHINSATRLSKGIQIKFPNGSLKNDTEEKKFSTIKMPSLGRGGLLANDK